MAAVSPKRPSGTLVSDEIADRAIAILQRLADWNRGKDAAIDQGKNPVLILKGIIVDAEELLAHKKE